MRTICTLHVVALAAMLSIGFPHLAARAQDARPDDANPVARDPAPAGDANARASEATALVPARITGNEVNVRSGPSVNFKSVGKMQRGDLVLLEAVEGEWCRVRVPGGPVAHVFAPLVEWKEGALRARVTARDVLLRATPGKAFFAFKDQKLNPGDELIVLLKVSGEDGDWLRVLAPESVSVWVFGKYVDALSGDAALRADVTAARRLRQDALTDGRTRTEREEHDRAMAVERAFESRLADAERRLAAGLLGSADADTWRTAADDAPSTAHARQALDLSARIERSITQRQVAEAARAAAEDAARTRRAADEAARKAREEAARIAELERKMREAQAKADAERHGQTEKPPARAVAFEGTLTLREDGTVLVISAEGAAYEVTSSRYRLPDYVGRIVSIRGTQPPAGGKIAVTTLRVVPSAR